MLERDTFSLGDMSVTISYTPDTTAPTLSQVTAVPSPTNDTTPNYTFSSTEAGTIAYGGDCSSATTAAVSGSNTVTFNTLAEGTHSGCTIKVTDAAGNQSSALNVNSFIIDNTAPTAAITYSKSPVKSGDSLVITATFNENMANSPTPMIAISGAKTLSATNMTRVDATHYTYTFTVGTGNGAATVSLSAGKDLAGNVVTSTPTSGATFTIDNTAPTVTINQASGQADPTMVSPVNFTVVFSEPVSDFATGDVTISGTAGGTKIATVTGSGTTYNVAVTGMTTSGTVIAAIAAGAAHDAAGNANTASTASDNSVTYAPDTTPPSVVLSSTATSPVNGTFPVTATFSETVTGFTASDINVTNGTVSNFSGSDAIYTFDVTPTAAGTVNVNIPAGAAQDTAGNPNTPAVTLSRTYDAEAFTTGLVTMSFDDGYKSAFDHISLLGSYKGSFFITTENMLGATACDGDCYTDYMTIANAKSLYDAGNDVSSHTRSHPDLTTITNLPWEVDGSRLDLLTATGIPVNTLAYPFGTMNDTVKNSLESAGYVGARTVDSTELNTKSTDRYALYAKQVNSDTTVADVQGWIDEAIANKQWLILVFHNITDSCSYPSGINGTDSYCTTPGNLSSIVAYLNSKGSSVNVITAKQGLASMDNSPVSDGIAPVITQPDIIADATSASGTPITFSPTVTDADAGLPAPLKAYCTIPNTVEDPTSGLIFPTAVSSGSIFPIGTTTVTCTAADTGGNLATHTFTVTVNKISQTITFDPLTGKTYGDADFSVSAIADSGLPVSYSTAGDCTLSGTTVHITGAGSCTITAHQTGDSYRQAAPDVAQTFTINKAAPVLTWSNPADITYPAALDSTELNATANIDGTFTYAPTVGTVLNAGNAQTLHVDFTPTDTVDYSSASQERQVLMFLKVQLP